MPLTVVFPDDVAALVEAQATSAGVSAEQFVRQVVQREVDAETRPSVFDRIARLWEDLPEEALAALPSDGAHQHDHYIYGTPKRKDL